METSDDASALLRTAKGFESLGDYRDSKSLAERCRKRANEISEAKREEYRRIALQNAEARRKQKKRKRIIMLAVVAVCCKVLVAFIIIDRINTENRYNDTVALIDAGQYKKAIAAFESLEGYRDSAAQIEECNYLIKYQSAEKVLSSGDIARAAILFASIDYKDSKARSMELWGKVAGLETISADDYYTVGLKADGTVVAVGDNLDGQCDVSDWTDIKLPE